MNRFVRYGTVLNSVEANSSILAAVESSIGELSCAVWGMVNRCWLVVICCFREDFTFREHPILEGPDIASRLGDLISDQTLRHTFGFN